MNLQHPLHEEAVPTPIIVTLSRTYPCVEVPEQDVFFVWWNFTHYVLQRVEKLIL